MDADFGGFRDVFPDWKTRLDFLVETMRELSLQEDPESMVRAYGNRIRQLMPVDRLISLSRRGLEYPWFRVTRDSFRKEEINPWREKHRLPLLKGGLLADLIYADEPRILDDVQVEPDDPALPYVQGMRSLMAIPHFDKGHALNMPIFLRREPNAFPSDRLPEHVWMSNLFGRATYNLVLSDELKHAYAAIEDELRVVAGIQRSLLPGTLPRIPRLDLAASYHTSRLAGGDYYDVFPLPGGKWGLLIADVSGHGTPAAVMMAITHALAHTYNGEPIPPSRLLSFVNGHLTQRYTHTSEAFVTAFYGIFDPATRELWYSNAGHNPPRVKRCANGSVLSLDECANIPLGLFEDVAYGEARINLTAGDQLILYTDGITEAINQAGEMYGVGRLDAVIGGCQEQASDLIDTILKDVDRFTESLPADDDRTLLVGKIS